ncbi:MAG TPA: family 43 glycosylhydrolase [Microlunatus sp.]|nr:family 43 glycosylhydrolase [Microlunatus sp.]
MLKALIGLLALLVTLPLAGSAEARAAGSTYRNPISTSFADTYADPAVIQGKDGWWYAYATSDPLRAGDQPGLMHIARTRDWRSWEYLDTVFDDTNRPSWATATSGLWAPDVRYVAGRYVLYFTVTDTTLNAGDDSAIGAATAPTPVGPWTSAAAPVVAPRGADGDFRWTFDPAGFTDVDGQQYLYYGSYYGGLWATRVSDDGLRRIGTPTQVAIDNRYEGSYVIRHDGWYYLMASAANCCAGPTTGYSVFAGRSRSPLGPFLDADGISLLESAVGGTTVLTQNGNRWIGAGHHAVFTDTAGQTFIAYHAIDREQPWLTEPFGINRRPMLLDRLDWIDGWPRTRAGAGPSQNRQDVPVTGSGLGITAEDPAAAGFSGLVAGPVDPQAGDTALLRGAATSRRAAPEDRLRFRADLRGDRAATVVLGRGDHQLRVVLDPVGQRLTLRLGRAEPVRTTVAFRPGWRTLSITVDGSRATAQLSSSDLADPAAEVDARVPGFRLASAPVQLVGTDTVLDNVSVRPLARPRTRPAPTPTAGRLLGGEEFDDPGLAGWDVVRPTDDVSVAGGALRWRLTSTDLVGTGNNASVLLRDPPAGRWIAETKVSLDLGEDTVRNYQQAGLIAYRGDDDFARLGTVAIWNTRQTEYGRELVATDAGRTSYGGAVIGTPAPTVWLRLAHTTNRQGEHLFRAGTSRDGRQWTWGATWTFAAGETPRIGLVAHGGAEPATTATFDYLRFYRLGS